MSTVPAQTTSWWKNPRHAAGILTGTMVAVIAFCLHYFTLPEPRYIRPHSADDWAAWGTWIGGIAGTVALVFAAWQIRQQATATRQSAAEAAQRDAHEQLRRKETAVAQATAVSCVTRTIDNYGPVLATLRLSNPTDKPLRQVQVHFNGAIEDIVIPAESSPTGRSQRLFDADEAANDTTVWHVGSLAAGEELVTRVQLDYADSALAEPPVGGSLFTTLFFVDVEGRMWSTDEDGFPTYRQRVKDFKETALQLPD